MTNDPGITTCIDDIMRWVMNRCILAGSLLLILGITGFASIRTLIDPTRGPRDPDWERIQINRFMVVGVDPGIPPFGEHTETGPIGLDPDIALEIGRRIGVEVRFTLLSFDGLYDALLLDHVDMVIAALRPDPLRLDRVRYTPPYFDAGHILIAKTPMNSLDDVKNKILAVEFASEGDLVARQVENITIQRFFTAAEAIDAVRENKADAALVDRVSASLYLQENPDDSLFISADSVMPDPYMIALRRRDWRLYQAVENALLDMQSDGTLDSLRERWLSNTPR